MNYKRHGGVSRKFDSGAGREFARALSAGDYGTVHQMVSAGGRHENRRAACQAVANTVLRKLGEFPLPKLEYQVQTDLPAVELYQTPTEVNER